jgi:hypothetical protein
MKMSVAQQLRTRWEVQGMPPCEHPHIEQEHEDYRGAGTGDYVCTTCGALFVALTTGGNNKKG